MKLIMVMHTDNKISENPPNQRYKRSKKNNVKTL